VRRCFENELTGVPAVGAGFGHSYNGQEQAGRARSQDQGLENTMQRDGKVAVRPKALAPYRCMHPGDPMAFARRRATGGLHQLISSGGDEDRRGSKRAAVLRISALYDPRLESLKPRSSRAVSAARLCGQYRAAERCRPPKERSRSRKYFYRIQGTETFGRQLPMRRDARRQLIPATTGITRHQESIVLSEVAIAIALRNFDTASSATSRTQPTVVIEIQTACDTDTHAGFLQGLQPEALLFGRHSRNDPPA
jgi:hypothetical protein